MNFFDIQTETFFKMIRGDSTEVLRANDQSSPFPESEWKILLFDDFTFNIVSNFKLGDLRESNVTLHLHIKEQKEELGGVLAIYFISPCKQSLDYFLKDLEKSYFEQISLNFIGFVDKELFNAFAQKIIELRRTTLIREIRQHNLDFYPLTQTVATLALENTFANDSAENYDLLARKLLGVLQLLKDSPAIIFDKNSRRLERLFESLSSQFAASDRYFKPETTRFKGPKKTVLLLWESAQDLGPFFVQEFKYLPMIVEIFGAFKHLNGFNSIQMDNSSSHIDLKSDAFWRANKFEDFPVVLENIYQEVGSWKQKYDKLNASGKDQEDFFEMSENFNDALESLPQMTEQNKINQNHTKIASFLMKEVERKGLEKFCVISSEIFQTKRVTRDLLIEIYGLFENKELQTSDKIRLLCSLNYNTSIDIKEYEKLEKLIAANSAISEAQQKFLASLKQQKFSQDAKSRGLFEKFKTVSGNILKNVLSENVKSRLANVLLDVFRKKEVEGFKVKALVQSSDQLNLDNVTQVIVFSIDGGCLKEIGELNLVAEMIKRDVAVVVSELMTGSDVIQKLMEK